MRKSYMVIKMNLKVTLSHDCATCVLIGFLSIVSGNVKLNPGPFKLEQNSVNYLHTNHIFMWLT